MKEGKKEESFFKYYSAMRHEMTVIRHNSLPEVEAPITKIIAINDIAKEYDIKVVKTQLSDIEEQFLVVGIAFACIVFQLFIRKRGQLGVESRCHKNDWVFSIVLFF